LIDWTGKAVDKISILGSALLKEIIGSSYIHVDETGLKVLVGHQNNNTKKAHNGYLWCYNNSLLSKPPSKPSRVALHLKITLLAKQIYA
jgi:hypothetical protein